MDITLLNVRVVVEKTNVTVDSIGNHKNEWTEFYSCFAKVSGENGKEKEVAGTTVDKVDIFFTIRYCEKISNLNSTEYRVLFNKEPYNILSVDHMNYKNKFLKLKCEKTRK